MRKLTIGVVDYVVGNHASVRHCLHRLGLGCRVSDDPAVLESCDLLVLPGVGAFRLAMQALHERSLDRFILREVERRKPILGICLGMQLLCEASHEHGYTTGLALIPGEAVQLAPRRWHIGWNVVEQVRKDALFEHGSGQAFYFNHSYAYQGPEEFQVWKSRLDQPIAALVRRDRIVGMQFHPEKSQEAGRVLLQRVIGGLCNA